VSPGVATNPFAPRPWIARGIVLIAGLMDPRWVAIVNVAIRAFCAT
jgi:hypothetical protein